MGRWGLEGELIDTALFWAFILTSCVRLDLQGYIDLSKRRVSAEEAKKCEEKFNKGKQVNSILRHVADLEKAVSSPKKTSSWQRLCAPV
jgi:hypothetical protein